MHHTYCSQGIHGRPVQQNVQLHKEECGEVSVRLGSSESGQQRTHPIRRCSLHAVPCGWALACTLLLRSQSCGEGKQKGGYEGGDCLLHSCDRSEHRALTSTTARKMLSTYLAYPDDRDLT